MTCGTPLEIACTPKPWRRPLGLRCGPAGMSAAVITAVTCRHAVIRLHGQSGHRLVPRVQVRQAADAGGQGRRSAMDAERSDDRLARRQRCLAQTIASGLTWTSNRAAACCFATLVRQGGGPEPQRGPVVIWREIRPAEVLMWNLSGIPPEIILAPSDTLDSAIPARPNGQPWAGTTRPSSTPAST